MCGVPKEHAGGVEVAQKTLKHKGVPTRASGSATDPCNSGDEITTSIVLTRPNGSIELHIAVCGSSAQAVVDFADRKVFSQMISGSVVVPLEAPGAPGDYLLIWALAPTAASWRAQAEVAAQTADPPAALPVQFRHRKTSDSAMPVPKWAVFIRVRP